MTRTFTFEERLDFSKAQRGASTEETIRTMLDGCASVRPSTRDEERAGVDYVAELRGGALVLIDEKRRESGCSRYWRHDQPEVALEIWSVVPSGSNRGVAGWTLSESKSTDLILFTFDAADCSTFYLLPFQHLRMAFRRHFAEWRHLFRTGTQTTERTSNSTYGSSCLFVPIDLVIDAIVEVSRLENAEERVLQRALL